MWVWISRPIYFWWHMKFNIFFTIRGPARTIEISNSTNPVECQDLSTVLAILAEKLPNNHYFGLEAVGIRVELAVTDAELVDIIMSKIEKGEGI